MAEASELYFCHQCAAAVSIKAEDFICAICGSGCIEEYQSETNSNAALPNVQPTRNLFQQNRSSGASNGRRRLFRRGHPSPVMVQISDGDSSVEITSNSQTLPYLNIFMQEFFHNLGVQFGGNLQQFNVVGQSMGDYAWGPDGLDNILTQLLNQIDNTGPPPAQKVQIDSLPISEIGEKEVENNAECAVCREVYRLEEIVKCLPCSHMFHPPCVDPWLELHDSCPVCRCNLDGQRPKRDTT